VGGSAARHATNEGVAVGGAAKENGNSRARARRPPRRKQTVTVTISERRPRATTSSERVTWDSERSSDPLRRHDYSFQSTQWTSFLPCHLVLPLKLVESSILAILTTLLLNSIMLSYLVSWRGRLGRGNRVVIFCECI